MPVILHVFKIVQLNLLKKGNTQTYPRSSLAETIHVFVDNGLSILSLIMILNAISACLQ